MLQAARATRLSRCSARGVASLAHVVDSPAPVLAHAPVPLARHVFHPAYRASSRDPFWRNVPVFSKVATEDFLSYQWSIQNTVQGKPKLFQFLNAVVPDEIRLDRHGIEMQQKEDFIEDVMHGVDAATMSIRLTRINWSDPRHDPIFRQFLPLKSVMRPDHPRLTLDSLHETLDSPVQGLVHRYPDKALFLATSVCPTYCSYCTRAYGVGANTDQVTKTPFKPTRRRWDQVFAYIENTHQLQDIVVSGGDTYYLQPEHIQMIGDRLLDIPHIRRFRFASKGLAVAPGRILDPADAWGTALVDVSNQAKKRGKSMALHTHFNHPNEISWITEEATQKLHEAGVMVRNQSVLLRGVNDHVSTMSALIRKLADNNISPYYVYQCDMTPKVEHFRTPLQTILDFETQIRGTIAGFQMPQFVVDLPGGGGKRLACSYETYDRKTGVARFVAPAVTRAAAASLSSAHGREKPEIFEYFDPVSDEVVVSDGKENGV